jgi:hypothetical protein
MMAKKSEARTLGEVLRLLEDLREVVTGLRELAPGTAVAGSVEHEGEEVYATERKSAGSVAAHLEEAAPRGH